MILLSPGDEVLNRFVVIDAVGAGGQSICYQARDRHAPPSEPWRNTVFLKQFHDVLVGSDEAAQIPRHFETLRDRLADNAEYICLPICVGEHRSALIAAYPWLGDNTLRDQLGRGMDDEERARVAIALCKAVRALHNKGVAHLDLKPSNVAVQRNRKSGKLYTVLVDLDAARIDGCGLRHNVIGSHEYMSPEHRDPRRFGDVSFASDVFAVGIILSELLFRLHPLAATPDVDLPANEFHSSVVEAIVNCLATRPSKRPTVSQVYGALVQHRSTHLRSGTVGERWKGLGVRKKEPVVPPPPDLRGAVRHETTTSPKSGVDAPGSVGAEAKREAPVTSAGAPADPSAVREAIRAVSRLATAMAPPAPVTSGGAPAASSEAREAVPRLAAAVASPALPIVKAAKASSGKSVRPVAASMPASESFWNRHLFKSAMIMLALILTGTLLALRADFESQLEPAQTRARALLSHVTVPGYVEPGAVEWQRAQDALWLLAWMSPWDSRLAAEAAYCGGRSASAGGRDDEALASFMKARAHDPNWAQPHNSVGLVYSRRRDYEAARRCYSDAIRLEPRWPLPYLNMGTSFLYDSKPAEARKWYALAVALAPNWPLARIRLGDAWMQDEEFARAVGEYDLALTLLTDGASLSELGKETHRKREEALRQSRKQRRAP